MIKYCFRTKLKIAKKAKKTRNNGSSGLLTRVRNIFNVVYEYIKWEM